MLALSLLISICADAQTTTLGVTLDDMTMVTAENEGGLYFAGTRNTNFRFSQRITPHGDCIDVVNGYAFVTWYKGGVENRNLMLSRKNLNVVNSDWVTIEFPHQHVGIRGEFERGITPARGDSHNTAAIGISTIDNTVHIIYDMHSYTRSLLPNSFFNYTVSQANAAFLPDEEFTLDKFLPKQNMLNDTESYERMTYPWIMRADDGSLIARYREGGSGNGDILFSRYDGTGWSNHWTYHEGTLPEPNTHSLYGGERFLNGRFYSCFSIRYDTFRNYTNNNGFYFAFTNDAVPTPQSQWLNANNQQFNLPFQNPDSEVAPGVSIKIAEPSDDYGTADLPTTSFDPAWTVTPSGAIHVTTRVDGRNVHYYRAAGDTEFSSNNAGLIPNPQVRGKMFSFEGQVFMVELIGGRLNVKTTPEGTDAWKVVYTGIEEERYQHFNALVEGDKLYVYLMLRGSNEAGVGDSRPLFFQQFTLTSVEDTNPVTPREPDTIIVEEPEPEPERNIVLTIEAEDFDEGGEGVAYSDRTAENTGNAGYRTDEGVDIDNSSTASGGRIVTIFEGTEFLRYTFSIETAGEYDILLTASNRNRDDSIMDVEINGQLFENVNIARTGDWDVFAANVIPNISLSAGENVIIVTQRRSQSSRFDKIDFDLKSTLSTGDITNASTIAIYPNPSEGIFNILSPKVKELDYRLINIQGQLIDQGTVVNGQLNFSRFTSGIYFIELSNNTINAFTKKLIIR